MVGTHGNKAVDRVGTNYREGEEPTAIVRGELVLDIYDSSTKQLLWHGTAKKALEPQHDQETRLKNLGRGTTQADEQVSAKIERVKRVLISLRRDAWVGPRS
jgi:hypothetical protein